MSQDSPHQDRRPSVPTLVDKWADVSPEACALSFPSGSVTFAELAAAGRRAAARLARAGVRREDRVAVFVREFDVEYIALCLGAMRLGAPLVPVNARNKTVELEDLFQHARPSFIVVAPEFESLIAGVGAADHNRVAVLGDERRWPVVRAETPSEPGSEPDDADLALILYTSGTTATPKGCLHSHATLLAQGENCAQRLGLTSTDRLWSPLTFFHIGGWQGLMAAWAAGACYSHVGFFTPDAAIDQLERERCTIAFPAFEPIWLAVLDRVRSNAPDLSALRVVINVAVPESLKAMQAALPGAIQVSCIGMTEAGGSICMGSPLDDYELRTESSGRPLPRVEVRVIDPAGGGDAPAGVVGELVFRSPSQFLGYFGDPAKTAEVIDADGWVRTGDLVMRNADGAYSFVSRQKDMLKVGGENVAAVEIERYLVTHPAVALAAVVRAPDGRYGEVPAAFVQLADGAAATEEELIEHCLGRIATFRVPRYVRFVDSLPTTGSGKVQKLPLETQIADELRERGIAEAPKLVAR